MLPCAARSSILAWGRAYYPADLLDGTPVAASGKVTDGIYGALAAAGILDVATARVTETFHARTATSAEAAALRIPAGSPVLVIDRVTRTGAGHAIELLRRVAASRVRVIHDGLPLTAPA
ncbi:UTRA domain-containing protein [Planomonospora sp. ID82291]|uniref:UTRA domain-containing protein n=1 Tax=Planomonospora sp. ID82291 TaxID=2738136 RepID=UPI0018C37242|nr:UTRA domain-containing protein [Planomonospora sp. ID82291]MBG0818612.1 UTRA domain-containing protein [Planomonospora sp. ID82291]